MSLGKKLAELRTANNYSTRELADKIGVSQSSISLWESDSRRPDFNKLKLLANLYGVSVDYLLGNDGADIEARSELNLLNERRNDLEIEQNILKKRIEETEAKIKNLEMEVENDKTYKFSLSHSISHEMLFTKSDKNREHYQSLIRLLNLKNEQTEKLLENEKTELQDLNNRLTKNAEQLKHIYQLIDEQRNYINIKKIIKSDDYEKRINKIIYKVNNNNEEIGKYIIEYLGLTESYKMSGLSMDEYLTQLKRKIKRIT